jgi:hypothetical protein
MRSKRDRNIVDSLRSEEYIAETLSPDIALLETYKKFVLESIAELAESGLSILHQPSDEIPQLYLITGGVFCLGEAGVTRLS